MSIYKEKPEPLFELVTHEINIEPGLTATSAGYENSEWRYRAVADYLFDWLPEFALKYSDLEDLSSATMMRLIKRAAKTVYTTPKYEKRGEFGELLLHALIREVFDSQPAISKIYYKSTVNKAVEGFDAVHVVENGEDLELWLGEAKFHKDINRAITEVVKELEIHMGHDYLREEFILISSKVDPRWPHAKKFEKLLSERNSLDNVFKCICIPVLLTYESKAVLSFNEVSAEYKDALLEEVTSIYKKFSSNELPKVRIHLFLFPLADKDLLVSTLQKKLEGLQR